ncbi:MAG: glycosyltransferase family 39 protein [Lentisphaerota bacterium]
MNAKTEHLLTGGALMLIIVLGAWLRFHAIGAKTVWLDESFSIWLANQSLHDAWRWMVSIDQHPPAYYTLLHFWQRALGDTQGVVRGLSALCGVLTLPVFFAAVRRLLDRSTALIATFILAVAPFHVRFAQETRMYALLTLGVATALYFLSRALTDRSGARWPWFGLAFSQAAVMLTHNTATVFFPLALNLPILAAALVQRVRPCPALWPAMAERGFLGRWIRFQVLALACWLPWAYPFYIQSQRVCDEFWIKAPNGHAVWRTFETFNFAFLPKSVIQRDLWNYLYWGLAALGLVWLRRRAALGFLLLSLFAIPVVGELLVSLKRPLFYDRTLIWCTLPYYILLAAGIRSLGGAAAACPGQAAPVALAPAWRRTAGVIQLALLAVVIGLSKPSLSYYFDKFQKEDWAQGAAYVARNAAPGDLVLFNATWVQIPFEYYYRRHDTPVRMKGLPVDLFDRGILEPKMTTGDLPCMAGLLKDCDRVWLVYSHDFYTDPQQIILRSLDYMMTKTDSQKLVGLRLMLYEGRKRAWDVEGLRRHLAIRRPHSFSFDGPEARSVAVCGTFNAWDSRQYPMARDTAGVWRIRLDLPLGAHEYEFKIDDQRWTEDPKNPLKQLTPSGYYVSLLNIEEEETKPRDAAGPRE